MPCFERKALGTYRHCPTYAVVTCWKVWRKCSFPQVGTEYRPACRQLHRICIHRESSWNTSSKTLEPDRSQYDTRHLCYRPTVFCWQLLLIPLSFPHGKIGRTFQEWYFLSSEAFAKLRKRTVSFVMSAVCRYETRFPLDRFSRNFVFEYFFRKISREIQVSLKSEKTNVYFACRPIYI